jgi:hypothetical protein
MKPSNVFGYLYGSIGTMVMGAGMSLVLTDIGSMLGMTETLIPGIVIGAAGMVMALTAYPIYRKILTYRKKKYAAQILELSEKALW